MLPALFLSHGAPTFPLTDAPAKTFLEGLAAALPERPTAILMVSAHWETPLPMLSAVEANETIHDFYGFPAELYRMRYPAPGSPELVHQAKTLLDAAGFETTLDASRGLDHGAWVPLRVAFPAAEIPVVQLSVQTALGPEHHLKLGRALAPLRGDGVLIIGSGSFTHDLSSFRDYREAIAAPEPEWVTDFADWMTAAIVEGRCDDLLRYRSLAPNAARNHPTEEHLLPLFVALGAGGGEGRQLHASAMHSVLRMDAHSFG